MRPRQFKRACRCLLIAISLMLTLASAALWVRSYSVRDSIVSRIRGPVPPYGRARWACVRSDHGSVSLMLLEDQPCNAGYSWSIGDVCGSDGFAPIYRTSLHNIGFAYHATSFLERVGFRHEQFSMSSVNSFIDVTKILDTETFTAPDWAVLLLSAVPTLGLVLKLWYQRHRPGTCQACGYDLRATPAQCPECGLQPTVADA